MQIVEVVWDDAHVTTESMSIKRATKLKPVRTHTIGYLMSCTEEGISLATDTYPKLPKEGKCINFMGWGMIVDWYEIKCE